MQLLNLPAIAGCFLALAGCRSFSRIERDIDEAAARRYAQTGDLEAEVVALAQPLVDANLTPGLVVGILLPDQSVRCFGFGVIDDNLGYTPECDTLFAIGSNTKSFLAATAAVLVQEGKLAWEDSLAEILPAHISLSPDAERITILQLATHTSGLPRQPSSIRTALYFIRFLFDGSNFYRQFDRDFVFEYLKDFEKPELAGDIRYSNIGFGLLGYILTLQTGMALPDLMHEKLFSQLGLQATGFAPSQLTGYSQIARGHAGDQPKFMRRGTRVPEWDFSDLLIGSAGLHSTAADVLAFARALLYPNGCKVLDRALKDTLDIRLEGSDFDRALAWAVDEVDGHRITFQIGFVSGFSAYIGMDQKNATAVVVLQNSLNWTESIGHRLLLLKARARQLTQQQQPEKEHRAEEMSLP